jgi:hypothetical protein
MDIEPGTKTGSLFFDLVSITGGLLAEPEAIPECLSLVGSLYRGSLDPESFLVANLYPFLSPERSEYDLLTVRGSYSPLEFITT